MDEEGCRLLGDRFRLLKRYDVFMEVSGEYSHEELLYYDNR